VKNQSSSHEDEVLEAALRLHPYFKERGIVTVSKLKEIIDKEEKRSKWNEPINFPPKGIV
jgi:hypothetical protein